MRVLLLEPDRLESRCIADELSKFDLKIDIASTADDAVVLADKNKPDAVILELSLPGHSGTEFLYEFRTYPEWADVPIVLYTSAKIPAAITGGSDWKLLNVAEQFYKPTDSIQAVVESIVSLVSQE
ncbi:MAG: DNA-binding response OmpR family regulator [Candidatus Saccharimonadales bacterium]|jgi:DNA-binding response OmpR family regulator